MPTHTERQSANGIETTVGMLRRIGQTMREARQARGEDLYDVAEYLRIKPSYLFALEEGDLSMTPGRTYALGFLRSYGDYLGYDGTEVVRLVKEAVDGKKEPTELVIPRPTKDERRPSGIIIAASILAAGVIYGLWHVAYRDYQVLERVAAVPGEIGKFAADLMTPAGKPEQPSSRAETRLVEAPLPLPTTAAPTPRRELQPAPPPTALEAPEALQARSPAVVEQAPPFVARDSSAALAAETPSSLTSARSGPAELAVTLGGQTQDVATTARVVLHAREHSWIQIRSPSRDYVRTATLEPGQRFAVPDRNDLALWTGNAGGVEVFLDGKSVGVLGEAGKVVRDVPLSPEALRSRPSATP